MYTITKEFEFSYAHRIWNQILDGAKSNNALPKCRHIHGHNARLIVGLASNEICGHGVVLDYNELNFFKKFIDDTLDHKYLIDEKDPLRPAHMMINKGTYKEFDVDNEIGFQKEYLESFIILPFVPTSENLAKWFFDYLKKYLGNLVYTVTFSESQKTTAAYVFGELPA